MTITFISIDSLVELVSLSYIKSTKNRPIVLGCYPKFAIRRTPFIAGIFVDSGYGHQSFNLFIYLLVVWLVFVFCVQNESRQLVKFLVKNLLYFVLCCRELKQLEEVVLLLQNGSHFGWFGWVHSSFDLYFYLLSSTALPWQMTVKTIINAVNKFLQVIFRRRESKVGISWCIPNVSDQWGRSFRLRKISKSKIDQFDLVTVRTSHHVLRF